MSKTKNRNNSVEALRGICMILVMLCHFGGTFFGVYQRYKPNHFWYYIAEELGQIGVACFFMITGFFMFRTNNMLSVKEFFVSKIKRLYVPYAISVTITFLFVWIFGLPGRECDFIDYLKNVLFVSGFMQTPLIDGAHWFMYFLVPITVVGYFFHRTRLPLIVIVPLILLFIKGINIIFNVSGLPENLTLPIRMMASIRYWLPVLLGASFCLLIQQRQKKSLISNLISILLMSFIVLWMVRWFSISTVCSCFVFGILLTLSILGKLKSLAVKPLLIIGFLSYYIYLIHSHIGYIFMNFLYDICGFYVSMCLALVLSVGLGAALMFIEKYLYKMIKGTIN